MGFSPDDVRLAVRQLTAMVGQGPSQNLQQEYEAGLHPTLLAYEKVERSILQLPVLTRYLVGAQSFLNPYANYFNIYAAHRSVYMVQLLARSIDRLRAAQTLGLDTRLNRLLAEKKRDAFDAIAFEIFTAARYAERPIVRNVAFLEETGLGLTPDMKVDFRAFEAFVECKKIDRTQDAAIARRNEARDLLNPVLASFRESKQSVLLEVTFNEDPDVIEPRSLAEASRVSLQSGCPIIEQRFTVLARRLPPYTSDDLMLFPSAQFEQERYGYRVRSEWIGLVQHAKPRMVCRSDLPPNLQGGMPTRLEGLDWDAAAKWKVGSEEAMAKYRRFAFGGVFHGLKQIENRGLNSTVHVWLESDYYSGERTDALKDLRRRIEQTQGCSFGWLVVNETLFDVSPKGRFDLVEHAHTIQGPSAVTQTAVVSNIFVWDGETVHGEFGEGTDLPDIDDDSCTEV